MENMDQTIPFVVLAAIGLMLLFLLRRPSSVAAREETLALSPEQMGGAPTVPLPEVVAAPIPSAVESLPSPIAPTEAAKPIKKRITKTAPKALEPTPIETVVGLLQHKDTLVAAFLLREIFDPPVSRR